MPALQLSAVRSHFCPHVVIAVAPSFHLDAGEHVEVPSWLGLIFKVIRNLTVRAVGFFLNIYFSPPNSNPNHTEIPADALPSLLHVSLQCLVQLRGWCVSWSGTC